MTDRPKGKHDKPEERPHRFHGHNDDARWRALAVFLEAFAERTEEHEVFVRKQLTTLTRKLGAIVASLQEVKDELEAVKAASTAEHAQFAEVQQALADRIAELEAIIAAGSGGATPEELDALLAGLREVHAQVSAIVPDEPTP